MHSILNFNEYIIIFFCIITPYPFSMNKYRFIALTISLVFSTVISFAQSNEIKLRFIGNCGIHLSDGKNNLYIDFPYKSGAYKYMKFDASELDSIKQGSIFLFTHKHADHYSKNNLKKIKNKHNGRVYGTWNKKQFKNLNTSLDGFSIEVYKTKHRFTFKHHSYLITWHGKRIFLSGDTESADLISTVKEMDWAFIPYWIMLDAKERGLKIDTKYT